MNPQEISGFSFDSWPFLIVVSVGFRVALSNLHRRAGSHALDFHALRVLAPSIGVYYQKIEPRFQVLVFHLHGVLFSSFADTARRPRGLK